MTTIEVNNLSKEFSNQNKGSHKVLDNISFNIDEGEFVTIFGPNGCGKTTMLNIIAGIENSTLGNVLINQRHLRFAKIGFFFSLLIFCSSKASSIFPFAVRQGNMLSL